MSVDENKTFSHWFSLFIHQESYISLLSTVSLEIGWKPHIQAGDTLSKICFVITVMK